MRVKLSYSVELEDVPQEAVRPLTEGQHKQEALFLFYSKIIQTIKQGDTEAPLEAINQSRMAMAELDASLQDISNILLGYNQTRDQIEADAERESAEAQENEEEK